MLQLLLLSKVAYDRRLRVSFVPLSKYIAFAIPLAKLSSYREDGLVRSDDIPIAGGF